MKYDFLISKLKTLVASERKITSEIIELVREIDQKRIYLDYGHTSMFAFLTKDFGYSPSAAMRRIDAARLSKELPQVQDGLRSGDLNLSQVSMIVQSVRQKEKDIAQAVGSKKGESVNKAKVSKETKAILLEKVKSLDLMATQKILMKDLDIKTQTIEKKTYQKDESVRLELTVTKEDFSNLERVKELISHQNPNPSISDVISFLANQFLNQKDPLRKETKGCVKSKNDKSNEKTDCIETAYAAPVPASRQNLNEDETSKQVGVGKRKAILTKIRLEVFKRDQCCQWMETITNHKGEKLKQKCQSKFQLQVDHIKPRWQDGDNSLENLQLLCAVHNKHKFRQEISGLR